MVDLLNQALRVAKRRHSGLLLCVRVRFVFCHARHADPKQFGKFDFKFDRTWQLLDKMRIQVRFRSTSSVLVLIECWCCHFRQNRDKWWAVANIAAKRAITLRSPWPSGRSQLNKLRSSTACVVAVSAVVLTWMVVCLFVSAFRREQERKRLEDEEKRLQEDRQMQRDAFAMLKDLVQTEVLSVFVRTLSLFRVHCVLLAAESSRRQRWIIRVCPRRSSIEQQRQPKLQILPTVRNQARGRLLRELRL